eukprot:3532096-Alexandrium_andersonii.AAC.1
MSASLVGSEMCIRDRLSRPRPAAPRQGSSENPHPPCERQSVLMVEEDEAVSYTHLTLPTICSV